MDFQEKIKKENLNRKGGSYEVWPIIKKEAELLVEAEPELKSFIFNSILKHSRLSDSLSYILSHKLASNDVKEEFVRGVFLDAYSTDKEIINLNSADIFAVYDRDPACTNYLTSILYMKGFHALASYRLSHYLWQINRKALAFYFQSRISEVFHVDIHPAAKIGKGIMIDHATSVVIGETAVIGDDVSMLHEVTLGGTGKDTGDRHPKVGNGVLIGAGAKILGNVKIGEGAKVGAGSVVLDDVPAHTTAVGVPAEIVGEPKVENPALYMEHRLFRK